MSTKIQVTQNWAFSAGGLPISLYASHDFTWNKTQHPILFMGGAHGDEPEGVWLAEATLKWLTENPAEVKVPWILVTCMNPDGFSKNTRMNSNGVDLNRNFPEKNWSSFSKGPRYFPGREPGSEPEVKAI